jgi:hypothetical protein
MGRPKADLVLRPEQREQLEGMAGSRSLPAGLVSRARIILLSASGKTNQQKSSDYVNVFPGRDTLDGETAEALQRCYAGNQYRP